MQLFKITMREGHIFRLLRIRVRITKIKAKYRVLVCDSGELSEYWECQQIVSLQFDSILS